MTCVARGACWPVSLLPRLVTACKMPIYKHQKTRLLLLRLAFAALVASFSAVSAQITGSVPQLADFESRWVENHLSSPQGSHCSLSPLLALPGLPAPLSIVASSLENGLLGMQLSAAIPHKASITNNILDSMCISLQKECGERWELLGVFLRLFRRVGAAEPERVPRGCECDSPCCRSRHL